MDFIMSLDPRILWVIGGLALVLGVIAIIKKAISLAITAMLVFAIMTYGGTTIDRVKQDFNIELNGTTATITVLGKEHDIDITKLDINVLEDKGDKKNVEITYDGKKYTVDIPTDIVDKITNALQSQSEQ